MDETRGRMAMVASLLISIATGAGASESVSAGNLVIDFEELSLPPESHENGASLAGGFTSRGAFFNNQFTDFGGGCCWNGWAYSNETDTHSGNIAGQYSAIAGGGAAGSAQYAVAFSGADAGLGVVPRITLPAGGQPDSVDITNNTFAAVVMRDGDTESQFTARFGGADGSDPDWFRLQIQGQTADGETIGSVEFYLADYRPPNSGDDFIVDDWTTVDLTPLQDLGIVSLAFRLDASQANSIGILTPAYVAIDNLTLLVGPDGDFDADGDVDGDDLTRWHAGYGQQPASHGDGDADRDGDVDGRDWLIWQSQWAPATAAATNSVPEPGAAAVLWLMIIATTIHRRTAHGDPPR